MTSPQSPLSMGQQPRERGGNLSWGLPWGEMMLPLARPSSSALPSLGAAPTIRAPYFEQTMARKTASDSARTLEGHRNAAGMKLAIVASRFNDFLVDKLVEGAMDAVVRHGGSLEHTTLAWVPGAFEIPLAASTASSTLSGVSPRNRSVADPATPRSYREFEGQDG